MDNVSSNTYNFSKYIATTSEHCKCDNLLFVGSFDMKFEKSLIFHEQTTFLFTLSSNLHFELVVFSR